MSNVTSIMGALGGGVVFVTALVVIMRGIFGQVHATEDNTRALDQLGRELGALGGKLDSHEQRISRLEGREK